MHFTYDDDPNPFRGYQAGVAVQVSKRLRTIAIYATDPARQYRLDYETSRARPGRSSTP